MKIPKPRSELVLDRPDLRSDTGKSVESAHIVIKERSSDEEPSSSKRIRQKDDISERRVQKQFFQFPVDIMCEILCRLPIEALVRCRCVCKTWHRVTMDPGFIKLQMNLSNNQPPRFISQPLSTKFFNIVDAPGFVIRSANMPQNRDHDSNRLCLLDTEEGKARHMPLSEDTVKKYRLLFSYNGLICVAPMNCANPLILCNPITKEKMKLPRIDDSRSVRTQRVGLCYETARQNHVLVRVFEWLGRNGEEYSEFFIITPEECSYRLLEHPPCVDDCEIGSTSTVHWNHAFHWRISKKKGKPGNECILSFDTVHETFQIISFPRVTNSLGDLNLELLVLDGHLTLIELAESKMRLWEVTGNKVGEFSLVHTGVTYETHVRWGTLFRCSFLARVTQNLNLVKIRYGRSGPNTIQSHFAFASKDMSLFTPLKIDGLPDDSLTLSYHPSLVSVHSTGFHSPSIL